MDELEFFQRMRRQNWIELHSPAAVASLRSGRNTRNLFLHGLEYGYRTLVELRAKEWLRMNGRKNKGFVQNIKFCDVELTAEGKAAFKAWEWSDDDTIGYIERMGSEGYKIGSRYDGTNGTWIASLTCNAKDSINYEWCLSARGRSFLHAFAVVAYKDLVLLENNWASKLETDDNDAGWG